MHDHDSDLSVTATELCATRLLDLIEEFREAADDAACTAFLAAVAGAVSAAVAEALPTR